MQRWDRTDRDMTPARVAVKNLQEELGVGASDECFHCDSFDSHCKPSIKDRLGKVLISKGDWTYVGHEYGQARIRGKLARILFVSMERPKSNQKSEPFEETQRAFRAACFHRRNPHMGGTDIELEFLLDPTPPEKRCMQFALTNSVRCRPVSNRANSRSTPTMVKECKRHTNAIIATLQPDVIVTQGKPASESIANLYETNIVRRMDNGRQGRTFRFAEVGQAGSMLFLRTAHPANHVGFRYKRGPAPPYLRDAIAFLRSLYAARY